MSSTLFPWLTLHDPLDRLEEGFDWLLDRHDQQKGLLYKMEEAILREQEETEGVFFDEQVDEEAPEENVVCSCGEEEALAFLEEPGSLREWLKDHPSTPPLFAQTLRWASELFFWAQTRYDQPGSFKEKQALFRLQVSAAVLPSHLFFVPVEAEDQEIAMTYVKRIQESLAFLQKKEPFPLSAFLSLSESSHLF